MTHDPGPPPAAAPSADAREVAEAIRTGWIGRGFKLGLGFFLAGLVIWLIPMMLLVSCVGGIAAMAGGAALSELADADVDFSLKADQDGVSVRTTPPKPEDQRDAAAAAEAAARDAAVPPPTDT
jgi:hypothetical protein